MSKLIIYICLWLLPMFCSAQNRPNIVFIAIDDLRPELGCYGSKIAITPNMDKFAKMGLMFNKAYCQQAICGPSRASLLTGIRPQSSGIIHNYIKIRDVFPDVVTLPQHFGNNGYQTIYYGKIFHHGDLDDELSWNTKPLNQNKLGVKKSSVKGYALAENQKMAKDNLASMIAKYGEQARYGLGSGPAYEFADVPDHTFEDGLNTDLAIESLNELTQDKDKPFFLALGFNKPHLNWVAPKKYWDLYESVSIPLAKHNKAPENSATMGLHASFELRTRADIPKDGEIDTEMSKNLMRAYLSCVSYVDAQIGRLMQALDEAGIRDNTIVIIWSDHGWHLGDMGIWGKATNYEIATRVPLMISVPNITDKNKCKKTDALVELVDIYPTLCDLANIKKPDHLEGNSFVNLINNPNEKGKSAAFSQFPTPALREWGAIPLRPGMRETYFGPLIEKVEDRIQEQQKDKWDKEYFENELMGYAMRTERYRLVVWADKKNPRSVPIFMEIYDHKADPSEKVNIASKNKKLADKLYNQFLSSFPDKKIKF